MRRSIGLVLVGLGVLLLVLAPLSRWYAYPQLAVASDETAERVSTGSDVVVLDLGAVISREGEIERSTDVRSVRRIVPDRGAGSDDTAVWETSVTTYDDLGQGSTDSENVLSYLEERVAFDRHTGENVAGHGQFYTPTGERADRVEVDHTGYFFKLPFDTQRRDYEFWDSTIQDTRPLEFDGETTLDGLTVYRFVQEVEPTPVTALEVPGYLFGATGAVVADRVYSTTRTLWVEPRTGAVIKGEEEQHSYLEFEGQQGPAIVQGTIAYTSDQVAANVDEYSGTARTLEIVRTTGPLAALALGAVLVVIGSVLARRTYRGRRRAALADGSADVPDDGAVVAAMPNSNVPSPARPAAAQRPASSAPPVTARPPHERTPLQRRPVRPRPEQPVAQPEPVRAEPVRPEPARSPDGALPRRPVAEQPRPPAAEQTRPAAEPRPPHDQHDDDDDVFDEFDDDGHSAGPVHRY